MTSAIESGLLPGTSEIRQEGLAVGGVLLTELARRFGTPLFVYDEEHLRRRCQDAVAAFGRDNVAYASKAFLCTAMARLAHEEGLLLDVASGGELRVALHAGVPADRIVLHGNNKDETELRTAMSARVRHLVVDSFDEMDRIERLHAEEHLPPPGSSCGWRPEWPPARTRRSGPAAMTRSSASASPAEPRRPPCAGPPVPPR